MTKKKELLREILGEIEEIKSVLNDVAKNLIPQTKEGPQLLTEVDPPTSGKFITEVPEEDEDDDILQALRTDGWSNK